MLTEFMKCWKRELGLDKWEIILKTSKTIGEEKNRQGEVDYVFTTRQAIITVLESDSWNNTDFAQDQEKTIIHELLHIVFAGVDLKNETSEELLHQIIDDLSKTLISFYRLSHKECNKNDRIAYIDANEILL